MPIKELFIYSAPFAHIVFNDNVTHALFISIQMFSYREAISSTHNTSIYWQMVIEPFDD